jgi:hypothetical protein
MIQGKRFGLSAVQKSDVWCRWKAGQSLHEIGRAFGKEHSSYSFNRVKTVRAPQVQGGVCRIRYRRFSRVLMGLKTKV